MDREIYNRYLSMVSEIELMKDSIVDLKKELQAHKNNLEFDINFYIKKQLEELQK